MFIAALFIVSPKWKLPIYSSRGEWVNKLWYIQINVLFINKVRELFTCTETWINRKIIMMNGRSWTQKSTYDMILFI